MVLPKVKVSITLSSELLERIDREVEREPSLSRSAVVERWLRLAARAEAAVALREETVRYYDSLTEEDRAEDEAIARAASRRARRLRID